MTRQLGGQLWPLLALCFIIAGCGSNSVASPGTAVEAQSTAGGDEPRLLPIRQGTLRTLLPQASEFQRELLSDGSLTLAEYESAKLAQIGCLRENGLEVVGDTELNGLMMIRFTVAATGPESVATSIISDCKREFANVVEMVWAEVSAPLIQEKIHESRRMMRECYDNNDLRVEDKPHDSDDTNVQARYRECVRGVQSALNMGGISYGVEGDGRPE